MFKLDGKKLNLLIAKTGLSVRAWGIKNNFPQSTLQAWITNRRNIKQDQLYRLALALDCKVTDISLVEIKMDHNQICENIHKLIDQLPDDKLTVLQPILQMMIEASGPQE